MAIRALRRNRAALIAAALALSPGWSALAADTCRLEAWSRDPDPAGLRIRAAPAAKAKVLGRMPATRLDDGLRVGPVFTVAEARGGWLRVRNVHVEDGSKPGRFPTAGWVHGSLVAVAAQTSRGHAAPKTGSAVLVDLGSGWVTPDLVAGVEDCLGDWAKLRLKDRPTSAWFNRTCANQWTTCDMPDAPR